MSDLLKRFRKDESGATAIEYAIIAGMLSIVIIGAATSIGSNLINIFTDVNKGFPTT